MNIIYFFLGGIAWLLVFWIGSILLEATGMQRAKARFQTLSAITGTGFTTSQAESVVNYPRRRYVISVLIIIGTTGIISLIVGLILFVRQTSLAPSLSHVLAIVITLAVIILLARLGVIGKLTSNIVRFIRGRKLNYYLPTEEIIYETGDYAVKRVPVILKMIETDANLQGTGLVDGGFTILAIEREDKIIPLPPQNERIYLGDHLLCYGKLTGSI